MNSKGIVGNEKAQPVTEDWVFQQVRQGEAFFIGNTFGAKASRNQFRDDQTGKVREWVTVRHTILKADGSPVVVTEQTAEGFDEKLYVSPWARDEKVAVQILKQEVMRGVVIVKAALYPVISPPVAGAKKGGQPAQPVRPVGYGHALQWASRRNLALSRVRGSSLLRGATLLGNSCRSSGTFCRIKAAVFSSSSQHRGISRRNVSPRRWGLGSPTKGDSTRRARLRAPSNRAQRATAQHKARINPPLNSNFPHVLSSLPKIFVPLHNSLAFLPQVC